MKFERTIQLFELEKAANDIGGAALSGAGEQSSSPEATVSPLGRFDQLHSYVQTFLAADEKRTTITGTGEIKHAPGSWNTPVLEATDGRLIFFAVHNVLPGSPYDQHLTMFHKDHQDAATSQRQKSVHLKRGFFNPSSARYKEPGSDEKSESKLKEWQKHLDMLSEIETALAEYEAIASNLTEEEALAAGFSKTFIDFLEAKRQN